MFTIMAQNVNEYRFEYTVGGAQAAKTRSLANAPGGQVKIHHTHILAVAMEAAGVAMDANGANHKNISLHMVEDLTLTEVEIAHPLSAVAPTWHAMMPVTARYDAGRGAVPIRIKSSITEPITGWPDERLFSRR